MPSLLSTEIERLLIFDVPDRVSVLAGLEARSWFSAEDEIVVQLLISTHRMQRSNSLLQFRRYPAYLVHALRSQVKVSGLPAESASIFWFARSFSSVWSTLAGDE